MKCALWGLLAIFFVGATGGGALADRLGIRSFVENESNLPDSYSKIRSPDIPLSGEGHQFKIFGGGCVVPNYKGQSVGDCTYNSVRSQLMERGYNKPNIKQPDQAWYGFDFLMPKSFPSGASQVKGLYNFAQWKGNNCPHVSLVSHERSSQLFLQLMRTTGTNDCEPLVRKPLLNLTSIKGNWARFEVFARWSTGEDGQILVFVNGRQVSKYSGPTLVALPSNKQERLKNHFDFGPYLCCTSGIQKIRSGTLYYANVSRAGSREALWK